MTVSIEPRQVKKMLSELLGRDVDVQPVETVRPHSATARGLVTDDDELVAVIASDLSFAHTSGAALAMMPADLASGEPEAPDDDLELTDHFGFALEPPELNPSPIVDPDPPRESIPPVDPRTR